MKNHLVAELKEHQCWEERFEHKKEKERKKTAFGSVADKPGVWRQPCMILGALDINYAVEDVSRRSSV